MTDPGRRSYARPIPRLTVIGDHNPVYETHRGIDRVLERWEGEVESEWLATDAVRCSDLTGADGVWVAPGSPYADRDAVLGAIRQARESGQPLLGSCGGFQHIVLEAVSALAGLPAAHAEEEPDADDPLVALLACSLVGEVRPVTCVPGTRLAAICGLAPFDGFHYCRFGVSPHRERDLEAAGLVIAARAPDAGVEAVELPDHRFFVGTMFQPQMSPRPDGREHPLLEAFLGAVSRRV